MSQPTSTPAAAPPGTVQPYIPASKSLPELTIGVLILGSILSVVLAGANAYLGMLKPQGKLCVVAQPLEMLSISVGMLYDNALRSIYGNYVGSRRDMIAMLAFAAEHNIESLVDILPFTDVNRAIDSVRRGNTAARTVLQR